MYNKIKNMWGIFKDDNEWNEKNVVGYGCLCPIRFNNWIRR